MVRLHLVEAVALVGAERFKNKKALLLLGYLALHAPVRMSRTYMAELLWLGASNPANSLSKALGALQQHMPEGTLIYQDEQLYTRGISTDVHEFVYACAYLDTAAIEARYPVPFLPGADVLDGVSTDFTEWVALTQQYLIDLYWQACLVRVLDREGDESSQRSAYQCLVRGCYQGIAPPAKADDIELLYTLLADSHPNLAQNIAQELDWEEVPVMVADSSKQLERLKQEMQAAVIAFGVSEVLFQEEPKRFPAFKAPSYYSTCIGRQVELDQLKALIAHALSQAHTRGFITLCGLGGVGKTRLAWELAEELRRWELEPPDKGVVLDGIYFVPLVAVEPQQLIHALLGQLDVALEQDPLAQLGYLLHAKTTLWILDQVEHLHQELTVLDRLQELAPHTQFVLTSRMPLNMAAEQRYPLKGLSFPLTEGQMSVANLEALKASPAVMLFVQRRQRLDPHFTLTQENAEAVRRVCAWTQGVPLLLELSASMWYRSPEALLHDLQELKVHHTERDIPAHQQTLFSLMEYSWRFLTEGQRQTLSLLALGEGGVAHQDMTPLLGHQAIHLSALLDQALLYVQGERYGLPPLVAEYVRRYHVAALPKLEAFQQHYSNYYLTLVRAHVGHGHHGQWDIARLRLEQPNIVQAWQLALEHKLWSVLLSTAHVLGRFLDELGRSADALKLYQDALEVVYAQPAYDPIVLASLLIYQADMYQRQGHYDTARALALQGDVVLTKTELRGDKHHSDHTQEFKHTRRVAQVVLGVVYSYEKRYELAKQCFENALILTQDAPYETAKIKENLGHIAHYQRQFSQAAALYQEAQQYYVHASAAVDQVWISISLGVLLANQGKVRQAQRLFEHSLVRANALHVLQGVGVASMHLAQMALVAGDYARAQTLCEAVLPSVMRTQYTQLQVHLLTKLAQSHEKQRAYAQAERALYHALGLVGALGDDELVIEVVAAVARCWLEQSKHINLRTALHYLQALPLAAQNAQYVSLLARIHDTPALGDIEKSFQGGHSVVELEDIMTLLAKAINQ